MFLHADSKESGQTGHTGNFVNLVMLRLKFQRQEGYFSNNNHVQKVSNFKREQSAK